MTRTARTTRAKGARGRANSLGGGNAFVFSRAKSRFEIRF